VKNQIFFVCNQKTKYSNSFYSWLDSQLKPHRRAVFSRYWDVTRLNQYMRFVSAYIAQQSCAEPKNHRDDAYLIYQRNHHK